MGIPKRYAPTSHRRFCAEVNLERFWQYVPVFYLGALRDAEDELSSRSQFWGRLLKAMEIPPALESRVQNVLDLLNKKLLRADPRLTQIASTPSGATLWICDQANAPQKVLWRGSTPSAAAFNLPGPVI